MTPFIKKKDIKKYWYIVNCQNLFLGMLSSYISMVLSRKNKSKFTPNQDNGDFVIVTNIEKLKFSGKKFLNKKYYKHTGYPGGIKDTTPYELKNKNKSQEVLRYAVKRMLPGGPLAKKQLSKLKMYYGEKHPHTSQNPIEVNFSKLNRKNKI